MATKPKQEIQIVDEMGTDVALPTDFLKELADEAKAAAAQERPAVGKFSTKAGMLRYGGDIVAGNNLDVIILYGSYRNTFYGSAYDPDNIKNPDCFSLAETDEGMVPDDNSAEKQNPTCGGCPRSAWGSDVDKMTGKQKKGKACKESRRLIMMPLTSLESMDAIKGGELGMLDLPVTSAKNYGALVNSVAATVGLPLYATVVNVKLQPHPRNQFEVIFTPIRAASNDKEVIMALRARVADAKRLALEPYDETSPTNSAVIQAEAAAAARAGSKF